MKCLFQFLILLSISFTTTTTLWAQTCTATMSDNNVALITHSALVLLEWDMEANSQYRIAYLKYTDPNDLQIINDAVSPSVFNVSMDNIKKLAIQENCNGNWGDTLLLVNNGQRVRTGGTYFLEANLDVIVIGANETPATNSKGQFYKKIKYHVGCTAYNAPLDKIIEPDEIVTNKKMAISMEMGDALKDNMPAITYDGSESYRIGILNISTNGTHIGKVKADVFNQGESNNNIYQAAINFLQANTNVADQSNNDQKLLSYNIDLLNSHVEFQVNAPSFLTETNWCGSNQIETPDNEPYLYIIANPIVESTTLHYNITTNTDISIGIYNLNGQLMQQVCEQQNHEIGVYYRTINLSNLDAGMYFCKLWGANGAQQSIKLLKL